MRIRLPQAWLILLAAAIVVVAALAVQLPRLWQGGPPVTDHRPSAVYTPELDPDVPSAVAARPTQQRAPEREETPNPESPKPTSQRPIIPSTTQEREAFIRDVLETQPHHLAEISFLDISERYLKQLDPGLSLAERQVAEAIVREVVESDYNYRLRANEALIEYVRTSSNLETPVRPHGDEGRTGSVSGSAFVGTKRTAMEVRYFLSYSTYPAFGEARRQRREKEAALRPYLKKKAP